MATTGGSRLAPSTAGCDCRSFASIRDGCYATLRPKLLGVRLIRVSALFTSLFHRESRRRLRRSESSADTIAARQALPNRVSDAWANVEVGSICLQSKTLTKTELVLSARGCFQLVLSANGCFHFPLCGQFLRNQKRRFSLFLRQSFASYRGNFLRKVTVDGRV